LVLFEDIFGLLCEGYDASNEIVIEIEISVEETKPEDEGGGEYLVDWLVGWLIDCGGRGRARQTSLS